MPLHGHCPPKPNPVFRAQLCPPPEHRKVWAPAWPGVSPHLVAFIWAQGDGSPACPRVCRVKAGTQLTLSRRAQELPWAKAGGCLSAQSSVGSGKTKRGGGATWGSGAPKLGFEEELGCPLTVPQNMGHSSLGAAKMAFNNTHKVRSCFSPIPVPAPTPGRGEGLRLALCVTFIPAREDGPGSVSQKATASGG